MNTQVYELLRKHMSYVGVSGQDYLVKCLNPEHDDSNPSLRVDRHTGIFNCLACGFKGNIFKYYNVFTSNLPIKLGLLKNKLEKLKAMTTGLEFPIGSTPFTKSIRGISADTIKHFEAFTTDQVDSLIDRIIFPIRDITGKIQVFNGRHLLSAGNPRYLYYPRHVAIPIFPASVPKGCNSIILVEGMFDLLNMYDKGTRNAVSVFGTQGLLTNTKDKLMQYKIQGVTHVYILFDGDDAGRKAAKQLKPLIEEAEYIVEIIELEDGKDPGDLSEDEVVMINNYIV